MKETLTQRENIMRFEIASTKYTVDQVREMVKNLGGPERALRSFRGETLEPIAIWKTIELGLYKTPDELLEALNSSGCCVSVWFEELLCFDREIALTPHRARVDLVTRSVRELGFKSPATFVQVCAKATDFGLEICSAEVGPQLCVQHKHLLTGEYLYIAMNVIADCVGRYNVFSLANDDGKLWLQTYSPRKVYSLESVFLFVLPRR